LAPEERQIVGLQEAQVEVRDLIPLLLTAVVVAD
jgi:hypothetical protein